MVVVCVRNFYEASEECLKLPSDQKPLQRESPGWRLGGELTWGHLRGRGHEPISSEGLVS